MKPKVNDNGLRSGRLSNEEKELLVSLYKTATVEEMAQKLNRRVDAIEDWVRINAPKVEELPQNIELIEKLHSKVYWTTLQKQFVEEELRSFEVYWVELVKQFNEDIEFSEEMQLVDLIKITLLINRNLEERAKAKREVEILQKKLDTFTSTNQFPPYFTEDGESQDIMKMNEYTILATGVKACEASYTSRTAELNTLLNKKDAYFEELKATRKQRIEVLKNIKKDFVSLIKSLMDEKIRTEEGLSTALMNAAADKEFNRLSSVHIYSDGQGDLPLLNNVTQAEYTKNKDKDEGNDL